MKALIFASGIGSRMGDLTKDKPKCLVEVNGKTILTRLLENLSKAKINDIIITTGYLEKQIRKHVEDSFSHMNIQYVNNPKYDSTNYIYSMWLAKDLIDDDVLIFHGDLVFEEEVMNRILKTEGNCVAINNNVKLPEKDFKGRVINNIVKEIGVNVFGEGASCLMPIYKISHNDVLKWLQEIGNFVDRGETSVYAENAFNKISDQIKLYPCYYKEFCMEIDTSKDLEIARNNLK